MHAACIGEANQVYNLCNEDENISILELAQRLIALFPEKHLKITYQKLTASESCLLYTSKIALAMGMDILVYSRTPHEDSEHIHYVDLKSLLKLSDYVSLHCPLNEDTYHTVSYTHLDVYKRQV